METNFIKIGDSSSYLFIHLTVDLEVGFRWASMGF